MNRPPSVSPCTRPRTLGLFPPFAAVPRAAVNTGVQPSVCTPVSSSQGGSPGASERFTYSSVCLCAVSLPPQSASRAGTVPLGATWLLGVCFDHCCVPSAWRVPGSVRTGGGANGSHCEWHSRETWVLQAPLGVSELLSNLPTPTPVQSGPSGPLQSGRRPTGLSPPVVSTT